MNSEQAMKNVADTAKALSLAEGFVKRNPHSEGDVRYAARRRENWKVAVQQYTDPFRSKTYA